jgi:DNA-binding protein H-NS
VREWDYKKIALNEAPRRGDDIDLLCDAGEEGWELVAILTNDVAYLKREVEQAASERVERPTEEIEQAQTARVERIASNGGTMSSVKPKYRDGVTGETWSGRGRMASWLKRKQDAGEDIDKYLV